MGVYIARTSRYRQQTINRLQRRLFKRR